MEQSKQKNSWICYNYFIGVNLGGHECPSLNDCKKNCEFGRMRSLSNCEICECNDPCESIQCPFNHECVMDESKPICRPSESWDLK